VSNAVSPSTDPAGRLAGLAAEADPLLERLRGTALEALAALHADDLVALAGAWRARERLLQQAAPLFDALRARAETRRPDGPSDAQGMVGRLVQTIQGVQAADARLIAELEAQRLQAVQEVEQLRRQVDRGAAYQPGASRVGKRIDLWR
jgi:hypothetical protein